MKKICLVLPYFGKFKKYFPLFLLSCKNNPTINWIIFSDSNEQYKWPSNVNYIKCTFDEFKEKVQKNFLFKICLDSPYKLCDFKPSYGEILSEELKEYDYWGYCDCDLIFGNIRYFVTDEILDNNDRVFTRGHLSIFRNISSVNRFYREQSVISYKEVYTSPRSFAFDEWGGISKAWENLNKSYYDELVMDDILYNMDSFYPTKILQGELSPYHKKNIDTSFEYRKMKKIYYHYFDNTLERVWIENRKIKSEEILYVHFQKRDMEMNFEPEGNPEYIILNNQFRSGGKLSLQEHQKIVKGETLHNFLKKFYYRIFSYYKKVKTKK